MYGDGWDNDYRVVAYAERGLIVEDAKLRAHSDGWRADAQPHKSTECRTIMDGTFRQRGYLHDTQSAVWHDA